MEKREEELIVSLADRVPELQALYGEHIELKKRLEKLNHKHYLTPEEEVEKKRLQKLKLAGKDRMMAILAAHRTAEAKSGQPLPR
jgi:uncharacterized protein YdcH (DUF465 family)